MNSIESSNVVVSGQSGQFRWIEGGVIGVPLGGPSSHMQMTVYMNTYTGEGVGALPEGDWRTVDVSGLVPEGTLAVRLDGVLIITHGANAGTADLTVAFRSMGQTTDFAYTMQACEAAAGGGARSTAGTWVALDSSMRFQVKWIRSMPGPYPAFPAYGFNLRVTAYLR